MEIDENPLSKLTYEEIKGLLGTFPGDDLENDGIPMTSELMDPNYKASASFDARTKWPNFIHPIRD